MSSHKQFPEYPSTPISMLKQYTTSFGNEGVTLIPNPAASLQDRDRKVVELESTGYSLAETFVLPDLAKQFDTTIGNVRIVRNREVFVAAQALLTILAERRIAAARDEYGASNVAVCRTMRFLPEAEDESTYEPHEYMALYARNPKAQDDA